MRCLAKAERIAVIDFDRREFLVGGFRWLNDADRFVSTRDQRGSVCRPKPLRVPGISIPENTKVLSRDVNIDVVYVLLSRSKKADGGSFFAGGERVNRRANRIIRDSNEPECKRSSKNHCFWPRLSEFPFLSLLMRLGFKRLSLCGLPAGDALPPLLPIARAVYVYDLALVDEPVQDGGYDVAVLYEPRPLV